jgi:hypothetical protein
MDVEVFLGGRKVLMEVMTNPTRAPAVHQPSSADIGCECCTNSMLQMMSGNAIVGTCHSPDVSPDPTAASEQVLDFMTLSCSFPAPVSTCEGLLGALRSWQLQTQSTLQGSSRPRKRSDATVLAESSTISPGPSRGNWSRPIRQCTNRTTPEQLGKTAASLFRRRQSLHCTTENWESFRKP